MYKKLVWILALPLVPYLFGFGLPGTSSKQQVTMSSLDPLFGAAAAVSGMKDDPVAKANVTYPITNVGKYDDFFKKSAEIRASLIASQAFTTATMVNMKATARSASAKSELGNSIKEVVGDKPDGEWSIEDTATILKLQKKKGEVTTEQLKGIGQSVATIGGMSAFLAKLPIASKDLGTQAKDLAGSVSTDFSGLAVTKVPEVTQALNDSRDSLTKAGEQSVVTGKELSRLGYAIKMAIE
jgi:hypothetical protein